MTQSVPDTSLISREWQENPALVETALETGNYTTCLQCGKVTGIGHTKEEAATNGVSNGHAVLTTQGATICRPCNDNAKAIEPKANGKK